MIRPSEVDISRNFIGSRLNKSELETVARNITLLSQAIVFAKDDDRWHPFTMTDYEEFRGATSTDSVSASERSVISELTEKGYLATAEDGQFSVTKDFLAVVGMFPVAAAAERVIAS